MQLLNSLIDLFANHVYSALSVLSIKLIKLKLKIQVQTVFYTSEISNFKSIFFWGILIAIIEASQPQ